MYLIGITGAIGHGKSTIAEILSEIEPNSITLESSGVISEIATELCKYFKDYNTKNDDLKNVNGWLSHLPKILHQILDIPIDENLFILNESEQSANSVEYIKLWDFIHWANKNISVIGEPILPKNKSDYRPLLQWIGGYCVENLSPTIWNTELIRRASRAKMHGCKLAILGGIRFNEEAVHIRANDGIIIEVIRPSIAAQDSEDPTERQRSLIISDYVISNDGSLDQLSVKVRRLYGKIKQANRQ